MARAGQSPLVIWPTSAGTRRTSGRMLVGRGVPMIQSIRFANFKALRDTALPLQQFTLLVGANGSGKSTVLQALEALRNPGHFSYQTLVTAGVARWEAPDA